MIRTMLDSDQLPQLTQRADIGAYYADLLTPTLESQLRAVWPALVIFDRGLGDPLGVANAFDVERGTLTPAQAVAAYDRQHAKGVQYLACYANRDTWPALAAALGNRHCARIYATLDGTADIPGFTPGEGPAAVQCLGAGMLGFHADLSLVFEDTWQPNHALARARANANALAQLGHQMVSMVDQADSHIHWLQQRLAEL